MTESIWDMSEAARRASFIERAVAGARAALDIPPREKYPRPMPAQASPLSIDSGISSINHHCRKIISETVERYGITELDLCSTRKDRLSAMARFEAAYRMRYETPLSLQRIGGKLGGRDHKTILYGVEQHKKRLEAAA